MLDNPVSAICPFIAYNTAQQTVDELVTGELSRSLTSPFAAFAYKEPMTYNVRGLDTFQSAVQSY